jgi:hypothetical protein
VIVLEIRIEDIAALKFESDPVIPGYRYRKFTFSIALQGMKTQPGKIHISKVSCAIENVQPDSDTVDHFRWNAF